MRGVPFDLLPGAERDVAEEERFRQHRCVAEVRERLALAAACRNPLVMVAWCAWEGFRRLEALELLAREEQEHVALVLPAVPGAREEGALAADDERAAVRADLLRAV